MRLQPLILTHTTSSVSSPPYGQCDSDVQAAGTSQQASIQCPPTLCNRHLQPTAELTHSRCSVGVQMHGQGAWPCCSSSLLSLTPSRTVSLPCSHSGPHSTNTHPNTVYKLCLCASLEDTGHPSALPLMCERMKLFKPVNTNVEL